MDWGASPSSWTCGFSEYTCTPGNGATDLRDCPAIYEDSIVVAPREMRSESEKRFEALMGEGGGDAAVPVAAVEHLEVGDAAPRATAIAVPDGPPPRAAPRGAFFANVGAMAEDAAAFRAWRDDHFPRQARAPAVVPPDFAAFCRGHDFATRGAYDAFVAAGGWAAYPGAVCAAVELDDLWEVDGGFRVAGRVVVSHYDGRVAWPSRTRGRRPATSRRRRATTTRGRRSSSGSTRSRPVSSSRRRATAPSSPSTSRRRRSASPSTRTARPARPRSGCPWAERSR
jgi:hypothetical protein